VPEVLVRARAVDDGHPRGALGQVVPVCRGQIVAVHHEAAVRGVQQLQVIARRRRAGERRRDPRAQLLEHVAQRTARGGQQLQLFARFCQMQGDGAGRVARQGAGCRDQLPSRAVGRVRTQRRPQPGTARHRPQMLLRQVDLRGDGRRGLPPQLPEQTPADRRRTLQHLVRAGGDDVAHRRHTARQTFLQAGLQCGAARALRRLRR